MDVWSMSSKRIQKLRILEGSFKDILAPIMDYLSPLEIIEFVVIAKAIWHRRNTWLFEQQFHPPSQVSKLVQAEMASIKLWLENGIKQTKVQEPKNNRWIPPPLDVFKANWDAVIDKGNSWLRIGVIVRNLEGSVMASLCSSMDLIPDPLLGEAVAAQRISSFCAELGLQHIVLEGDSLSVVKAIQHKKG
ncbi:uncharacterized protein LOC121235374 [Juglans microcarpa x Juglans regia]|uniref:uncharacterized protein LOC121235374 n=1 Tax=Juglans microcarpa x Juglans regia TaxID=2249226 RepID=UPI001B7E53B2|nr:uncharacterized protein LOC121235374 [Juglans microcarpa x Juglans regia]